MKALKTILLILLAVTAAYSQSGQPGSATTTIEGYLSDASCGQELTSLDGDDLTISPDKHPLRCIKFCKNSGFGVFVSTEDGKYRFLAFDKKGNKTVNKMLKTINKPDDLRIIITGIRLSNSFKLNSIMMATN